VRSQLNERNETDDFSRQVARAEGLHLDDLADGTVLKLVTLLDQYILVKRGGAYVWISGHPTFCPEPVVVEMLGSLASRYASRPKPGFIGGCMCLVFRHPTLETVTTSLIHEIQLMSGGLDPSTPVVPEPIRASNSNLAFQVLPND